VVGSPIKTFRRNILSLQYILSRIIAPIYKVNAKLAIGQLQLVMSKDRIIEAVHATRGIPDTFLVLLLLVFT
jgi:hypothetical protein